MTIICAKSCIYFIIEQNDNVRHELICLDIERLFTFFLFNDDFKIELFFHFNPFVSRILLAKKMWM